MSIDRFDPHPLIETTAFDTVALELDADGDLSNLALRGVLTLGKDRIHLEELVLARRTVELITLLSRPGSIRSPRAQRLGDAGTRWQQPASVQLAWDEFQLPEAWAGANFRCSGASRPRGPASASRPTARLAWRAPGVIRRSRCAIDGTQDSLHIAELELTQNPGGNLGFRRTSIS